MLRVRFYEMEEDKPLRYAVIAAVSAGRWVLCRHRERLSWELPGGHIEAGESAREAAARELYEETGAEKYQLEPVCLYSVQEDGGEETFGALFRAEIESFGALPESEIAEICLLEDLPETWTYPAIQPKLLKESLRRSRIERIRSMEQALNTARAQADALASALEAWEQLSDQRGRLFAYYGSPEWFADREADAAGDLPADLSRGVLTEDEPWDLLGDCEAIVEKMAKLSREDRP